MRTSIKSININAFRGIPHLELNLDGKNLLIKGDNGTGKSSIVQAFEYLFTGTVSSLEGTQGISVRKNLNHIKYKNSDINVSAHFSLGDIEISRVYDVEPIIPEILKLFFQGANSGKFILTRSEMLKFVLAKPSDRFKAISSIIGIEKLDEIEVDYKHYYEQLLSNYGSYNQDIDRLFNEISKILYSTIKSIDEILPVLNERRRTVSLPKLESLDQLSLSIEEQVPIIKKDDLEKYVKLSGIKHQIQTMSNNLSEIDTNLLNKNLEELDVEKIKIEKGNKIELIKIGYSVLSEINEDICPLCGNNIDRLKLILEIDNRMKILNRMSKEWQSVEVLANKYSFICFDVIKNYEFIKKEIVNLEFMSGFIPTIDLELKKIIDLKIDIDNLIYNFKKIRLTDIINLSENYIRIKNDVMSELTIHMSDILDSQNSQNVLELVDMTGKVSAYLIEINNSLKNKKILKKKLKIMKIIYDTYSKIKEDEIKKIYNAIKEEINDFYKVLHPDDPHYNIDIELSRAHSTNLTIDYSEIEDVHPKAYLSEGHQDSLGLCIFLAFAKNFNQNCNLLILDDVVSTIDSGHREYIGKLLNDKFSDYQHIITTHDDIWFQQVTKSLSLKRYVITKWTVDDGPILQDHIPDWPKILEKLEKGDKTAGNDSRRYLEWVLKTAAATTRTKLIYKPEGDYMIRDLYSDVKNRYEKILKDKEEGKKILTNFSELESRVFMANILSHDNPLIEQLKIEEISRFCYSVHNLFNSLCCNTCGSFLIYPEEIKRLQCPNEKCTKPTIIV